MLFFIHFNIWELKFVRKMYIKLTCKQILSLAYFFCDESGQKNSTSLIKISSMEMKRNRTSQKVLE